MDLYNILYFFEKDLERIKKISGIEVNTLHKRQNTHLGALDFFLQLGLCRKEKIALENNIIIQTTLEENICNINETNRDNTFNKEYIEVPLYRLYNSYPLTLINENSIDEYNYKHNKIYKVRAKLSLKDFVDFNNRNEYNEKLFYPLDNNLQRIIEEKDGNYWYYIIVLLNMYNKFFDSIIKVKDTKLDNFKKNELFNSLKFLRNSITHEGTTEASKRWDKCKSCSFLGSGEILSFLEKEFSYTLSLSLYNLKYAEFYNQKFFEHLLSISNNIVEKFSSFVTPNEKTKYLINLDKIFLSALNHILENKNILANENFCNRKQLSYIRFSNDELFIFNFYYFFQAVSLDLEDLINKNTESNKIIHYWIEDAFFKFINRDIDKYKNLKNKYLKLDKKGYNIKQLFTKYVEECIKDKEIKYAIKKSFKEALNNNHQLKQVKDLKFFKFKIVNI